MQYDERAAGAVDADDSHISHRGMFADAMLDIGVHDVPVGGERIVDTPGDASDRP